MPLRGKREPARGGEIENPRIARDLADHCGHIAAAQPFLEREESVFGFIGGDVDQATAKSRRQARPVRATARPERGLVLHP